MVRDGRRVMLAGAAAVLLAVIAYDIVQERRLAKGSAAALPAGAFAPVDVNHALEDELAVLPGIGPALAKAIVEERTKGGPFRELGDLSRVKGISSAAIERMRSLATCGP